MEYWAISYIIFSDFSCRIGICNFWNDPLGEFEGQTVLRQHGQSLSACFGSNERWFEPFVTAETGRRAWPMLPQNCLPFKFAQWIISKITYSNSTWKIWKNDIWYSSVLQFSSKIFFQLGVTCTWTHYLFLVHKNKVGKFQALQIKSFLYFDRRSSFALPKTQILEVV